jgi:hypothetical protein
MPSVEVLGRRVADRLADAGLPQDSAETIARTTAARGAELVDLAGSGALRHDDLQAFDSAALEAVISVVGRPSWFVSKDTPNPSTALAGDRYWVLHIEGIYLEVAAACRRVGAVFRGQGANRTAIGTGWMIGRRLLATNAHVAEHLFRPNFTGPAGPQDGWNQRPGVTGSIDFRFERERESPKTFAISGYRYIEVEPAGPDIALLTLEPGDEGEPPSRIPLETDPACGAADDGSLLFTVGHPLADVMDDANVSAVFGDLDGTKRFSPGESRGRLGDFVLAHDCSTVNGSSGSPVVQFSTGRVVGLHYWGKPGERNEAVFFPAIAAHPSLALVAASS